MIGYEYALVQVIFRSGKFRFEFYLHKIESGKNRIGFKLSTVRFEFGLSMFGSLWVRPLWIGFELGRVILSVGHFSSC